MFMYHLWFRFDLMLFWLSFRKSSLSYRRRCTNVWVIVCCWSCVFPESSLSLRLWTFMTQNKTESGVRCSSVTQSVSLICLYKLFWLMIWDLILSGCKMSHHEWLPQVTGNSQFDHWCQSYFWALTSHFNDFFRCERCLKQSQTCSEAFVQNLNLVQLEPGRFSKSLVWNPKVHFLGSNPG